MKFPVAELRAKASKFQTRIRRRNLREQVACVIVVLFFGWCFFKNPALVPRISYALIAAAAIYIAWHIQARGAATTLPSDMGTVSLVEFHRRELKKQRDLLRNIWKWYLGPMFPGMALLVGWGIAIAPPGKRYFPIPFAALCVVFLWAVGWINKRAARRLDRQIEELNASQSGLDLGR